jgi:hypothetical protein
MHSNSAAKIATVWLPALLLAVMVSAQTSQTVQPAEPYAVSKVRIVRISQVKGEVQLDRANGRGYEPAITNLPVVENSRLSTGNGVAEVEFEDNSSLRVTPNSLLEFPKLERLPGGTTVSSVHLVKGAAYVSLMKTPGNEFNLSFGEHNLRLSAASHVRLEVEGDQARLAVLEGTVHVESAAGVMDVPRKKSVTFEMNQSSMPTVAKAFTASSFDTSPATAAAARCGGPTSQARRGNRTRTALGHGTRAQATPLFPPIRGDGCPTTPGTGRSVPAPAGDGCRAGPGWA